VLRFVKDAQNERATWHAVVVHVQSNEEKSFTDFADAVAFIARYVPIGDFVFTTKDEGRKTEDLRPSSFVLRQSEQ
jgi:hypothetical protein